MLVRWWHFLREIRQRWQSHVTQRGNGRVWRKLERGCAVLGGRKRQRILMRLVLLLLACCRVGGNGWRDRPGDVEGAVTQGREACAAHLLL